MMLQALFSPKLLSKDRSLLKIILGIFLLSLLTACSILVPAPTPAPPTPPAHQTFQYDLRAGLLSNQQWHAGDTVQVRWEPRPGPIVNEATPVMLTLTMQLYGPYRTRQDAESFAQALSQAATTAHPAPASPILQSTPIDTHTWSDTVFTSTLALPSNIVPGFYVLQQQVEKKGSGVSGSNSVTTILEVVP